MSPRLPLPARARVIPETRRKLTRIAFAHLMLSQDGRCAYCSEKLQADAIIDEHLVPLDQGGTNDLTNRALLCRTCAGRKTARDQTASARGRRIRGETGQQRRQQRRRDGLAKQTSFATNREGQWKRKMTGEIVPRAARKRRRRLPVFGQSMSKAYSRQPRAT